MDPLGFTSSVIGLMGAAITVQKILFERISDDHRLDFVANDLPTLIAFLDDIKTSFLNSREQPPAAAEFALNSCTRYMDQLHHKMNIMHGNKLDRRTNRHQQWARIQFGYRGVGKLYRSFRDAVLLLKDICLFFMIQEINFAQANAQAKVYELESMVVETQRIVVDGHELGYRPDHDHVPRASQDSHTMIRLTDEHQSRQAYRGEVDDGSLLRLQRDLKLEYGNMTVFPVVICPEVHVAEGQLPKMELAIMFMDTGSHVNIVSEKYLEQACLSHLIVDIPEDEQVEISSIAEAGPAWKFERKFKTKFFLYSSGRRIETAEFFVTKSSDFDFIVSQKQFAIMAKEESSARQKLLWLSSGKGNKKQQDEQRAFEQRKRKELEYFRRAFDEREKRKQIQQREHFYKDPVGRAWTIDESSRGIMPASMSGGSGEGNSPIKMNSTDERSSRKLREASIRSGTMEDGSDDES